MLTGLKSVIYPTADLDEDKAFWQTVTGIKPYIDEPYYVSFKIGDCELGLDPNAAKEGISFPVAYWHVKDTKEASKKLLEAGAKVHTEIKDVGAGVMMGTFKDLTHNIFGIIDNPND